jgi:hypothetical protein
MSGCGCETGRAAALERRSLWMLMGINAVMFVGEAIAGWLGESTGLMISALVVRSARGPPGGSRAAAAYAGHRGTMNDDDHSTLRIRCLRVSRPLNK